MFQRARYLLTLSLLSVLTVFNPAIAQKITSITPSTVAAGSGGLVVSIAGSGFTSGSVVRAVKTSGTENLPTYFVNTNLLLAGVYAGDTANPGNLPISVANYETQSASNAVTLTVTGKAPAPPPPPSPPPPPPPGGGGCYGCYNPAPTPPPPPPPPPPPGGSGPVTSPPGSNMLVTVTSPYLNEALSGTVSIAATAKATSKTDGGIVFWGVFDSGNLIWVDINPDPSIKVDLALSKGSHKLQVVAYDDSFTGSTATIPVVSGSTGVTTTWHACMYTKNGEQYQAMQISPHQTLTGVLQSQMFWNSNCDPVQWTDQLNDVGSQMTFGAGSEWTYYFIHRADTPGVSAVWTMGNQTSGCVNYNTAPACN